jgi:hypothetical protein
LATALTIFVTAFFFSSPEALSRDRCRSTSASCHSASAMSPIASTHSSGLPNGCPATVANAPDWSADPPPPPHASCSASQATSRWTMP